MMTASTTRRTTKMLGCFVVALLALCNPLSCQASDVVSEVPDITDGSTTNVVKNNYDEHDIVTWPPATNPHVTVQDLHREYSNIFPYGNRNAASHKWSTFLLERASQMMTMERLQFFFSGFCSISGSPVRPNDYNRYRLTLPNVAPGSTTTTTITGYMHYCCWPCVCDTQDFIRVDTKNVTLATGETVSKNFAVIGNPCDRPEQLTVEFTQPYGRNRITTLANTAPEVKCLEGGVLDGATLSDHGYIIIGMFFDAVVDETEKDAVQTPFSEATPGRITDAPDGTQFHDEREWLTRCRMRAASGYDSGMGEIFRQVSAISPIMIGEEPSCASTM